MLLEQGHCHIGGKTFPIAVQSWSLLLNRCCDEITFSHLPCLREVYLRIFCERDGCCSSKFVHNLTRNAPKLQHLFLTVNNEVPSMLASIVTHSLKQLHLRLCVPIGFDLFTITDFLHAFPTLEALHIEMKYRLKIKRSPKRHCPNRLHFQLKKVTFESYSEVGKEIDFVIYLLRNSIALEQLLIMPNKFSKCEELNFNLLQGVIQLQKS
ncbi:uncharacterized protein LOC110716323 isoform X2 [Chenopodium quinoa]|uniref:uncharacterized protein LOC110716323 isoform X2 n=1 Tax=Chenopodium quinoa TaxID=63459 RepID=UPI000B796C19|nr:uncharacterized protein LOC110716323 isoform X2 [Chenopodium quinoa]